MSSVNKATILGSLGKDPEVRNTSSGGKIVNLSVATSERWNDKNSGERKERTEWHRVSIMDDRLADVAEKYLSKGSQVYLEGSIQTRKWTDRSGAERYSTEIVVGRFDGKLVLIGGKDKPAAYGQERAEVGQRRDAPEGHMTASSSRAAVEMQRPARGGGRPAQMGELDSEIPF